MREPSTPSCCVGGGLWSPWSGYLKSSSGWERKRQCLSTSNGCACVGVDTVTTPTCPCPPPANADFCTSMNNTQPHYFRPLIINHSECTATLQMVGHNDGAHYCHFTEAYYRPYIFVALLITNEVSGGCTSDVVFDCMNGEVRIREMNTSFTCDTSSLNWIYDWSGKRITAYNQAIYPSDT